MKKYIAPSLIVVAFTIFLIEAYHGDPRRLYFFSGFAALMWMTDYLIDRKR